MPTGYKVNKKSHKQQIIRHPFVPFVYPRHRWKIRNRQYAAATSPIEAADDMLYNTSTNPPFNSFSDILQAKHLHNDWYKLVWYTNAYLHPFIPMYEGVKKVTEKFCHVPLSPYLCINKTDRHPGNRTESRHEHWHDWPQHIPSTARHGKKGGATTTLSLFASTNLRSSIEIPWSLDCSQSWKYNLII